MQKYNHPQCMIKYKQVEVFESKKDSRNTYLYRMVGRVMAPSDAQNAVRAVSAAETAAVWMEWYTAAESGSACLSHSVWSSRPVVASVHCVVSRVAECLVHEICLYTQDTQLIVTSLIACGGSPWWYSEGLGPLSCSMISPVCTQMAIHLTVCKQS